MIREFETMSEQSLQSLEENLKDAARSVDEVLSNLAKNQKGEVVQSIDNCLYALKHDPDLCGSLSWNELTCKKDLARDVPWKRRGLSFTDTDESYIRLYLEKRYHLRSAMAIKTALDIFANENSFHPIRDLLNGLAWDGQKRIGSALHHFLGAEANEYTAAVLKMHMLAAIHRIYYPGSKYDIALCLVGPQGGGKSSFFRLLAIKDEWFSDDLRRLEDDNVYRKLEGHWIIEMAETAALAKAKTIEEMKAFLSRQKDNYKPPYDKYPQDFPRQCVFCGTSNDMQFLPFDRSGNRRFAPVQVDPARAEVHPLADELASREYILQMWAEAMVIFRSGEYQLHFTKEMEDYAQQMQKSFMPEDTELGVIEEFLEEKNLSRVCVRQIYCEAYDHYAKDEMPVWISKKITETLRLLGWKEIGSRKFKTYGSQKAWEKSDGLTTDDDGFLVVNEQMEIPFV